MRCSTIHSDLDTYMFKIYRILATNTRPDLRRLLIVPLLLCFISQPVKAVVPTWSQIGPTAATVFDMERDPYVPSTVYAGTNYGGLYKSITGGLSWIAVPSPFTNRVIFDVLCDPQHQGTIYVGTFQHGVYRSTDNGITWTSINTGLTDLTVNKLMLLGGQLPRLLAATKTGIFVSDDQGNTWSLAGSEISPAYSKTFLVDPSQQSVIFSGTINKGVLRSIDRGQNWVSPVNSLSGLTINSLDMDGLSAAVYASTNKGIFKIDINGLVNDNTAWQDISFNLADKNIYQVVQNAIDGTMLAATDSGVYQLKSGSSNWILWANIPSGLIFQTPSSNLIHLAGKHDVFQVTVDNGQTFYPADQGIQNRFIGALHSVNFPGNSVLYAGTDKGIEFTSDLFQSGPQIPWITGGVFSGAIFDIDSFKNSPNTLYAAVEREGVWKSGDSGATWSSSSKGMTPRIINQIVQIPVGADTLFAGTTAGIYRSSDSGQTWAPESNTQTPRNVTSIAVNPFTDKIVMYGTENGEIYKSIDGGNNFALQWSAGGNAIKKIAISPYYNIYAISSAGTLYSSTDDGANFFPVDGLALEHVVDITVDKNKPWVAYAATSGGGVFKTETRGLTWINANSGITNPYQFSISINPLDSNVIIAGTVDGIYRSADSGASWTFLSGGLAPGFVTRVQFSPIDKNTVFATVDESSVYRSTDSGASWIEIYADPGNSISLPVLADAVNPDSLYVGTYKRGLFRSLDNGISWNPSSAGMNLFVRTIVADQNTPGLIYAGSLTEGLFKSNDYGASWMNMGLSDRNIFKLATDPSRTNVVYAGTSTGISRSEDGGATWIDLGQRIDYVFSSVINPDNTQEIYVSGPAGKIYKSPDSGLTWVAINKGIPNTNVLELAFDATNKILYAGLDRKGIYKSSDGGNTWVATDSSINDFQITDIAVNKYGHVYIGTQKNGIYVSIDHGKTWYLASAALDSLYISDIRIDTSDARVIFAAVLGNTSGNPSLYKSTDGGGTWTASDVGITETSINCVIQDSVTGIYYAAANATIYESNDTGASWTPIGTLNATDSISSILIDPINPNTFYVGTTTHGILKSVDKGITWASTNSDGVNVRRLIFQSGKNGILASTLGKGLLVSDDFANTWSDSIDSSLLYSPVTSIDVDPSNSNIIYVGTGGSGIHKSVDYGASWIPMNNGLSNLFILALAIDSTNPLRLFAASSQAGVFYSLDGGNSWQALNNGLLNRAVTSIAIDAKDPSIVYAGTEGGGVYKIQQ